MLVNSALYTVKGVNYTQLKEKEKREKTTVEQVNKERDFLSLQAIPKEMEEPGKHILTNSKRRTAYKRDIGQ